MAIAHRIHGAGIYANIGGILMVNVTMYSIHGSYGRTTNLWFQPIPNFSSASHREYCESSAQICRTKITKNRLKPPARLTTGTGSWKSRSLSKP